MKENISATNNLKKFGLNLFSTKYFKNWLFITFIINFLLWKILYLIISYNIYKINHYLLLIIIAGYSVPQYNVEEELCIAEGGTWNAKHKECFGMIKIIVLRLEVDL